MNTSNSSGSSSSARASTSGPAPPPVQTKEGREEHLKFLNSLIGRTLNITTNDSRVFWGTFRCTDWEANIVLQQCYEYRRPTEQETHEQQVARAQAAQGHVTAVSQSLAALGFVSDESSSAVNRDPATARALRKGKQNANEPVNLACRYMGMIVVPGEVIVKVEVDEFASQQQT